MTLGGTRTSFCAKPHKRISSSRADGRILAGTIGRSWYQKSRFQQLWHLPQPELQEFTQSGAGRQNREVLSVRATEAWGRSWLLCRRNRTGSHRGVEWHDASGSCLVFPFPNHISTHARRVPRSGLPERLWAHARALETLLVAAPPARRHVSHLFGAVPIAGPCVFCLALCTCAPHRALCTPLGASS